MSGRISDHRGMDQVLEATADRSWLFEVGDRIPILDSSFETRLAISNGFLGVRGALAINRSGRWAVPPCTYVAGLFDTPDKDGPTSILVPATDWLRIGFTIARGDKQYSAALSEYRSVLDMKRGVLVIECRIDIASVLTIKVRTLRLVSMSRRAVGLHLIQFDIEQGIEDVAFDASFVGTVIGRDACGLDGDACVWRARTSEKSLAMGAASSLQIDGEVLLAVTQSPLQSAWSWKTKPAQVACFQRLVAFERGETPDVDVAENAQKSLAAALSMGWQAVVTEHAAAWAGRWRRCDIVVDSNDGEQQALRFALYHLNGAANPQDDRVSVGARALTGDDYHGHVFWDTEIYLLPFYTMTWPEAARAMLMYRYRTLDAARNKAAGMGWRGALYAWESADTGAETTPVQAIGPDRKVVKILCGTQEQHISADVAYAIWQYWQATADENFLREAGAEIILDTGMFWASRAVPETDGLHHIRGVIGPDEYHETIDDNAFTNIMARWNIRCAIDISELFRDRWPNRWGELSGQLKIDDAEIKKWRKIADTMATGLDPKTGLFEQFEGFFGLEEIELSAYAGRSVPMDVILGRERIAKSQIVKQADIVALIALLPDTFINGTGAANFRYYEPRCAHGSSLSRAMHGLAAAKLGYADKALAYFRDTSSIDLGDEHVAIAGGIHIAALGGIWQIAVLGFAGLTLRSDCIVFNPRLPSTWRSLSFPVSWRGRLLKISIETAGSTFEATIDEGQPITIVIAGVSHELLPGSPLKVHFGCSPSAVAE